MHHIFVRNELTSLESLARRAAAKREQTGCFRITPPAPGVHLAESEAAGLASVLRHRLCLSRQVPVRVTHDRHHPLLPGSTRLRAARLQLCGGCTGRPGRIFLASYDDQARLVLSIVGRCTGCSRPVPTIRIDGLEDFGDWLLGNPGQTRSHLFVLSPLHATNCPAIR